MKPVNELKNIHAGEDIYVVASGKSLDFIPTSFFVGKTVIGVNQVYKKLACDYIVRKEPKFIDESIESGAKVVISEVHSGDPTNGYPLNTSLGYEDNCYYFKHKPNRHTKIDFSVLGSDELIVSYSTITSAIHLAAYMGAKNIILVGHDCGLINNKFVFDGYYDSIADTPWGEWSQYVNWLKVIENQTIMVKQALTRHYNVNILSINPFINFGLEGNTYTR